MIATKSTGKLAATAHCRLWLLVSWVALLGCQMPAQQHLTVPRSDGRQTPLMLYPGQHPIGSCAPLAIISHGAGGSENGYRYLAQAMAALGYTTVVMGHRESGLPALAADIGQSGLQNGTRRLVANTTAETDRLLDLSAALKWASSQCYAPFRVLLGHSMGSETTMLEAGAKNIIDIPSPPAAQDRFDAYIALSPQGPGIAFADHAWSGIHKPVLILTGTRDQTIGGGPESRQIPWKELPGTTGRCQWLGVIDGATHMNFAGIGIGKENVESRVTQTIAAFLKGVRSNNCALPPSASGMTLQAK